MIAQTNYKSCPFCGGDYIPLIEPYTNSYRATCIFCFSGGPLCNSIDRALEEWNIRHSTEEFYGSK